MKILVLGGTGFLGHCVVAAALARGYEVVSLRIIERQGNRYGTAQGGVSAGGNGRVSG